MKQQKDLNLESKQLATTEAFFRFHKRNPHVLPELDGWFEMRGELTGHFVDRVLDDNAMCENILRCLEEAEGRVMPEGVDASCLNCAKENDCFDYRENNYEPKLCSEYRKGI